MRTGWSAGWQEPGTESCIQAASGRFVPALDVFAHLLRHLRHRALAALAAHLEATQGRTRPPDPQVGHPFTLSLFSPAQLFLALQKVKWSLVVPFFWSQEAKNFMREAAYQVHSTSSRLEIPWAS